MHGAYPFFIGTLKRIPFNRRMGKSHLPGFFIRFHNFKHIEIHKNLSSALKIVNIEYDMYRIYWSFTRILKIIPLYYDLFSKTVCLFLIMLDYFWNIEIDI